MADILFGLLFGLMGAADLNLIQLTDEVYRIMDVGMIVAGLLMIYRGLRRPKWPYS